MAEEALRAAGAKAATVNEIKVIRIQMSYYLLKQIYRLTIEESDKGNDEAEHG